MRLSTCVWLSLAKTILRGSAHTSGLGDEGFERDFLLLEMIGELVDHGVGLVVRHHLRVQDGITDHDRVSFGPYGTQVKSSVRAEGQRGVTLQH